MGYKKTFCFRLSLLRDEHPSVVKWLGRQEGVYERWCPGCPPKSSTSHTLWLAVEIPPSLRPLQTVLQYPFAPLKVTTNIQNNAISPPFFPNPWLLCLWGFPKKLKFAAVLPD